MKTKYLLFFLISLLVSCSTYVPSQSAHVYTTSTQEYHKLSAIQLGVDGLDPHQGGKLLSSALELAFLSHTVIEFYVEGRKVYEEGPLNTSKTLLQVPPGFHQIDIVYVLQSITTLGTKSRDKICSISVELKEGETGTLTYESCGDRQDCIHYFNFKSCQVIDGSCILN
jgi:hypothetical protein